MTASRYRIDPSSLVVLLGIMLTVGIFWNSIIIFPLKLFVVLLHELSHGLAAVLTGGAIEKIEINLDQGGVCYTRGGVTFIVLTAGYLGSMIWGGIILMAASRSRADKLIAYIIGLSVLAVTLLYIRNAAGFAFGILFGGAVTALAQWAPAAINDAVLRVIGLTSILYAVFDIKDDLISRQWSSSDAGRMASGYFGTPLLWGIVWIIIALVMAWIFLKLASKKQV